MISHILVVGSRHIHAAEILDGIAHIAWSGRVPCPTTSGAYGVGPDPQSINGDEPWLKAAAEIIGSITGTVNDSEIRPRLEAAGVPLI